MTDLERLKAKLKKVRIECLLKGKQVPCNPCGLDYEVYPPTGDIYNPTINALLKTIGDLQEEQEEEEGDE
tara:strand:+ start:57 stop:266 length:210 start_codon:yes stop_codon:yes gene_type:complete